MKALTTYMIATRQALLEGEPGTGRVVIERLTIRHRHRDRYGRFLRRLGLEWTCTACFHVQYILEDL